MGIIVDHSRLSEGGCKLALKGQKAFDGKETEGTFQESIARVVAGRDPGIGGRLRRES
jgi:hypothetical protein